MSVYTSISRDELAHFLTRFDQGELIDFEGIQSGITNTNYFVDTEKSRLVLTILEDEPPEEVPYFLNLTAHLEQAGIPCAHPIACRDGSYMQMLHGKPAALVQRLSGKSVEHPSAIQCRKMGETMAKMHIAATSFDTPRKNPRGREWWLTASEQLASVISEEEHQLMTAEFQFQAQFDTQQLPHGTIHADLFMDNALLDGNTISGVIDFYYACDDAWLYDVAIAYNDWCSDHDGVIDEQLADAFLRGYDSIRTFTDAERQQWPAMTRAAAMRFWLSRLLDMHFPKPGEMTYIKDPDTFRKVLVMRQEKPCRLPLAEAS